MEGKARTRIDVTRVLTASGGLPGPGGPRAGEGWLPRLCLAILEDAFQCLGASARHGRAAREWARSDAEYCFSFVTVCAVLNLDADAVRQQLFL